MQVLEGQNATRENILSSLAEVSCKAERGSVVVIHFSGHGYELPDQLDQGLIPATLTREMVGKLTVTPRWGSTNLLTNNKHET